MAVRGMDRGPEIWNALVRELAALLHIVARPGTAYRPVEQAPIEREHQEFRKLEKDEEQGRKHHGAAYRTRNKSVPIPAQ